MRRLALVLGVLFVGVVRASAGDSVVGWTLSESATDPFVNVGTATPDTSLIYLWLYCTQDTSGVAAAELGVAAGGSQFFVGFVPADSTITNSSSEPDEVDLSFSNCPRGALLVGHFLLWNPGNLAFDLCITPNSTEFASYGCDAPSVPQEIAYIGYSTFKVPCFNDEDFYEGCQPPLSVDTSSWGAVKARYTDY